jgi:hypothetical protein
MYGWTSFNRLPTYLMYASGWIKLLAFVSVLINSSIVPPSHTKHTSFECSRFCLFACTTSYFFFTIRFLETKSLFRFVNDPLSWFIQKLQGNSAWVNEMSSQQTQCQMGPMFQGGHSLVVSFIHFKMKQHCNNTQKKLKNINMAFTYNNIFKVLVYY